jgi:hypothetical protein
MKRVRPVPPIPAGKVYWPGYVSPALDPLVPAERLHEQCKLNMGRFDRLGEQHADHWSHDPTYDLRRRKRGVKPHE